MGWRLRKTQPGAQKRGEKAGKNEKRGGKNEEERIEREA